jgi:2-C-methyl-D-erythritol 2,4-cyclodiphosphate synthase
VRVGSGFDAHRLVEGRPLVLGGVTVPFTHGLLGHSDGDALLHAVMDALLGAAGLGDMGRYFPSSDPRYAGADSGELLRDVRDRLRRSGWRPGNVDATIVAERPVLKDHLDAMRQSIAALLELQPERVNVKAKSTDGLGALGAGEGIAATAVALVEESE